MGCFSGIRAGCILSVPVYLDLRYFSVLCRHLSTAQTFFGHTFGIHTIHTRISDAMHALGRGYEIELIDALTPGIWAHGMIQNQSYALHLARQLYRCLTTSQRPKPLLLYTMHMKHSESHLPVTHGARRAILAQMSSSVHRREVHARANEDLKVMASCQDEVCLQAVRVRNSHPQQLRLAWGWLTFPSP